MHCFFPICQDGPQQRHRRSADVPPRHLQHLLPGGPAARRRIRFGSHRGDPDRLGRGTLEPLRGHIQVPGR